MFDEVYVVPLITFSVVFNRSILYKSICVSMGVREGKLGGGGGGGKRKEICPTLSDYARVFKKNFPEKLSKIVVDRGGGVITKNSY
jgi:hypothetical protein